MSDELWLSISINMLIRSSVYMGVLVNWLALWQGDEAMNWFFNRNLQKSVSISSTSWLLIPDWSAPISCLRHIHLIAMFWEQGKGNGEVLTSIFRFLFSPYFSKDVLIFKRYPNFSYDWTSQIKFLQTLTSSFIQGKGTTTVSWLFRGKEDTHGSQAHTDCQPFPFLAPYFTLIFWG